MEEEQHRWSGAQPYCDCLETVRPRSDRSCFCRRCASTTTPTRCLWSHFCLHLARLEPSMAQAAKKSSLRKAAKTPKAPDALEALRTISSWQWEILAATGSVLFLVATICVLAVYNHHPIFDWHGVTLNASVSVLSTGSKTALLYICAEAIGQWKWILYAYHPRPLLDVQLFDAASRGPWGSTVLL